jgi:WG containing repeat
VTPATTKTYGSPATSHTTYTPAPSSTKNNNPSYRSSTPSSPKSTPSDGTSGSYKGTSEKPAPTAEEMAAYNDEKRRTAARIENEKLDLSQIPLFCSRCGSGNIATDIETYMKTYRTEERYLDRAYVPHTDIEALHFVSSRIMANMLNTIPKADALAFMDRLYWQLSHLNQFEKRKQLDAIRILVIQRYAGIAPMPVPPGKSGIREIISVDHKFGYQDEWGNTVIAPQYDMANNFVKGVALVQKGDKYGFIDSVGNVRVPFEYTGMEGKGDYVELKRKGKIVKFTSDGKQL